MRITLLSLTAVLAGCSTAGAPAGLSDVALFALGVVVAQLLWGLSVESRQRSLRRELDDLGEFRAATNKCLQTLYRFRQEQTRAQQKLSAELFAAMCNIDDLLMRMSTVDAPATPAASEVDRLRADLLGGTSSEGLPIPGKLSELRQQVEGINSTLGNQVKRLETRNEQVVKLSAQRAAANVAEAILRERGQNVWWRRLLRMLRA